jgi:hypothetical protein
MWQTASCELAEVARMANVRAFAFPQLLTEGL